MKFKSLRFAQFDFTLDIENSFTAAVANMNMNRAMIIAVEEKPITIFFKNCRYD